MSHTIERIWRSLLRGEEEAPSWEAAPWIAAALDRRLTESECLELERRGRLDAYRRLTAAHPWRVGSLALLSDATATVRAVVVDVDDVDGAPVAWVVLGERPWRVTTAYGSPGWRDEVWSRAVPSPESS